MRARRRVVDDRLDKADETEAVPGETGAVQFGVQAERHRSEPVDLVLPDGNRLVDDDEDILTASRLLLRREFASITTCRNPENIPTLLAENDFDVVLLDMNFGPGESSGAEGLEWLEKILALNPDIVVVIESLRRDPVALVLDTPVHQRPEARPHPQVHP